VKEFSKSVNSWWSYCENSTQCYVFGTQCIYTMLEYGELLIPYLRWIRHSKSGPVTKHTNILKSDFPLWRNNIRTTPSELRNDIACQRTMTVRRRIHVCTNVSVRWTTFPLCIQHFHSCETRRLQIRSQNNDGEMMWTSAFPAAAKRLTSLVRPLDVLPLLSFFCYCTICILPTSS